MLHPRDSKVLKNAIYLAFPLNSSNFSRQLGKTILAPPEEDPDKEEEVHNEETLANVNIPRVNE